VFINCHLLQKILVNSTQINAVEKHHIAYYHIIIISYYHIAYIILSTWIMFFRETLQFYHWRSLCCDSTATSDYSSCWV